MPHYVVREGTKWQQFGLMILIGFIFHSGIEQKLSFVKTKQRAGKEQKQNLNWISRGEATSLIR